MVAHLLMSAVFALAPQKEGFWPYLPGWLVVPARIYGAFTGSTGSYAFFSPDISPQLRARFVLHAAGKDIPVPLFPPVNHEAELRVSNLVDAQWEFGRDDKALEKNRALAASYAGKLLHRHPDAGAVTVLVEFYKLPPLSAGPQPAPPWYLLYQARFERARKP